MELFTTVKIFTVQAHGKERVDMSEHMLKVTLMTKSLDYYEMELVMTVKSFTVQTHGKERVDMSEHTSMKKTGKDENLFFWSKVLSMKGPVL